MFELIEFNPPLEVLDDEYQRLLGFPKSHQLTGRPRELADAARQWFAANGRPWIYAREIGPLELRDVRVHLAGTVFSSNHLHDSLAAAQAHSAVVLAASAMPQIGQFPGASRTICGCMGQVYFLRLTGRATTFGSSAIPHLGHVPGPILWTSGCIGHTYSNS